MEKEKEEIQQSEINNESKEESSNELIKDLDTKKDKKKKEKKPATKKKTTITSVIIGLISCLVGGFGGYVLYGVLNPEEGVINIGQDDVIDVTKIQKSLAADTLVQDYQDKPYQIVNYAFDQYASHPYSLTIGDGLVNAAAGVKQTIKSCTYNSPEGFFNQKVSSSSMVKTADRYYEHMDEKYIEGYECKYDTEWNDSLESKNYTYDEYIQSFGKLNCGFYYCTDLTTDEDNPIPDKFLTRDEAEYEKSSDTSKHRRNGALNYYVTSSSVLMNENTTLQKSDTGYHIRVDLDINSAVSFVIVQMKTTGRLSSMPRFTSCYLEIELDDELHLVSSNFHDEYRVTTGITTNASSDLGQRYFYSDSNHFINGSKEVDIKVPSMSEIDFNGFDLVDGE